MQALHHQTQFQAADGVKHGNISGNVLCGVMNHFSLHGSLMNESGFGEGQENVACLTVLCQLKGGGGITQWDCFFRGWPRPLGFSEGKS